MGEVMRRDLRSCRHFRLWKRLNLLNDGILVHIDKVALVEILILIHMRRDQCIANVLKAVLIILAGLTNDIV